MTKAGQAVAGIGLGVGLGALIMLAAGCATDPALDAYDRAARMGLTAERVDRPYARITDGAPWSRTRGVEVAR